MALIWEFLGLSIKGHRFLAMRDIIILGAARSGTRIVRDILGAPNCIGVVPFDVNYVWRYRNEKHPNDALPANLATPPTIEWIRGRISRIAGLERGGRSYVVEKTVSNVLRVPFVHRVFPDAAYVLLVRDGRDVVESALRSWRSPPKASYLLRKLRTFPLTGAYRYAARYGRDLLDLTLAGGRRGATWGPRYPGIDEDVRTTDLLEVCARQWEASMAGLEAAHTVLEQNPKVLVRYEELVDDPGRLADHLARSLQLPDADRMVTKAIETVRSDRVGSHRELSISDRERIEAILGNTLRHWGY